MRAWVLCLGTLAVLWGSVVDAACNPAVLTGCTNHIIPFAEYNAGFTSIEFCNNATAGFLPVSKAVCLAENLGTWVVRSDIPDSGEYNCQVCLDKQAAVAAPSVARVWALRLAPTYSYTTQMLDDWGRMTGSSTDEVAVIDGKRYIFLTTSYTKLQSLLTSSSYSFYIQAWQPLPAGLRVSLSVVTVAATLPPNPGPCTLRIQTSPNDTTTQTNLTSAVSSNCSSWGWNDTLASTDAGAGYLDVESVDCAQAFDIALFLASTAPAASLIDLAPEYVAFNRDAVFMSQKGTIRADGGNPPLHDAGLTGTGVVIGVADSGLDFNSCLFSDAATPVTFTNQNIPGLGPVQAFRSTTHRKIAQYIAFQDNVEGRDGGHGTHVCGSVAGFSPGAGANSPEGLNKGMAFNAKLAFFDVGRAAEPRAIRAPGSLDRELFPVAYEGGARLHSNSWGSATFDAPNGNNNGVDKFSFDNQDFLILFAAGNDGDLRAARTVGNPGSAKNCLTVGSHVNHVRNPDLSGFSSRGPTYDGRTKPDLCAPGQNVDSAGSIAAAAASCNVVSKSGTSMATPVMAGTAALVFEYFTKGFYPTGAAVSRAFTPMGALIKAVLINSGQRMAGTEANRNGNTFPSTDQGHGRVQVTDALFLPGQTRVMFVDGEFSANCAACPKLNQGQAKSYRFRPAQNAPLSITLVWHDRPPANRGPVRALVNDLNLVAQQGGNTFRGNNNPAGDNLNNVERIIIQTPVVGTEVVVTVNGADVPFGPQPYAIAVAGVFARTPDLFPANAPVINTATPQGNTGRAFRLAGQRLPLANSGGAISVSCNSNAATAITAAITGFSADGSFLDISVTTTDCTAMEVFVTNNGFESNRLIVPLTAQAPPPPPPPPVVDPPPPPPPVVAPPPPPPVTPTAPPSATTAMSIRTLALSTVGGGVSLSMTGTITQPTTRRELAVVTAGTRTLFTSITTNGVTIQLDRNNGAFNPPLDSLVFPATACRARGAKAVKCKTGTSVVSLRVWGTSIKVVIKIRNRPITLPAVAQTPLQVRITIGNARFLGITSTCRARGAKKIKCP